MRTNNVYSVYYVEPLASHTNVVVIAFLEQKITTPESRCLLCDDGKPHLVWDFSANDYEILKKSARRSNLCFRTWVEIIKDERPMLFETIDCDTVISAVATPSDTPHTKRLKIQMAKMFKGRITRGLHRRRPELEVLIKMHRGRD